MLVTALGRRAFFVAGEQWGSSPATQPGWLLALGTNWPTQFGPGHDPGGGKATPGLWPGSMGSWAAEL